MALDKYFREELTFLKEQGKHFTEIHPQLSRFLHGNTTDPDVERLLEGFAFLTAKLREKVEDEFPEFTHSIINMLWPNYLRPIPSLCIVKFTPEENLVDAQLIGEGTIVDSKPVLETTCHFKTCRDVDIYPMEISKVSSQHSRKASIINIDLDIIGGMTIGELKLNDLRLYLGGDKYRSQMLYLWMNHYLGSISVTVGDAEFPIALSQMNSVGFTEKDGLLPYPKNAYAGYRILQEYLSFPEAFHFFDIKALGQALPKTIRNKLTLKITFKKTLPTDVRISNDHFQLYCTPVINLFEHDANPIDLSGKKTEYQLSPSGRYSSHYEIFSVDSVKGWQPSQDDTQQRVRGKSRNYSSFESFQHEIERSSHREANYYRYRVKESLRGDGFDSTLAFVRGDETESHHINEVVSIKLSCSNRQLPLELGIGDISIASYNSPPFTSFKNITIPTQSLRPALDGSLLWTLISNLSLNYLSLLSKDALSSILRAYDFKALVDRQAEKVGRLRLEGIEKITSKPVDKIVNGRNVRGLQSTIYLNQDCFSSEGELYIFGEVLSQFFALYASINYFHQLIIINSKNKEKYSWDMQIGVQPLI